jgi:hypothetical protein
MPPKRRWVFCLSIGYWILFASCLWSPQDSWAPSWSSFHGMRGYTIRDFGAFRYATESSVFPIGWRQQYESRKDEIKLHPKPLGVTIVLTLASIWLLLFVLKTLCYDQPDHRGPKPHCSASLTSP